VIGVDTGGTFTDVILLDAANGRPITAKTPSSPTDPSRSFLAGIEAVLDQAGVAAADVARVLHGTTVATNLILEDKGAPTALLTTARRAFRARRRRGRGDRRSRRSPAAAPGASA
jgi:N-methylhydantoinase A